MQNRIKRWFKGLVTYSNTNLTIDTIMLSIYNSYSGDYVSKIFCLPFLQSHLKAVSSTMIFHPSNSLPFPATVTGSTQYAYSCLATLTNSSVIGIVCCIIARGVTSALDRPQPLCLPLEVSHSAASIQKFPVPARYCV